jgi:SAM-dependent methyltransferase
MQSLPDGWCNAKALVPARTRRWLRLGLRRLLLWPPVGHIRFGGLRRVTPISRAFHERGQSVDRYYIENFLATHAQDIQGRVLEVADDTYTQQFGSTRVTKSDILSVREGNPQATIVADLSRADSIPSATFDCIILTQTLQYIYDTRAALRHLYRILKPRGILLVTCPGIAHISRADMERWGDYWRFTTRSAQRLCEEVFPARNVEVHAHGNVLIAVAYLHGMATEELTQEELDFSDPDYQVLVTIRAVKPEAAL